MGWTIGLSLSYQKLCLLSLPLLNPPLVSLDLRGSAFSSLGSAGPVSISGRPQLPLTVDSQQPPILIAFLVPNTAPTSILALRGVSQRHFSQEAQLLPPLATLVNMRTTDSSCWLWSTTDGHWTSAVQTMEI